MTQFKTRIISNQKVAPDHYVLSFKTRGLKEKTEPGQFFNIRVSNSCEPLLRRPFSAHKIYKQKIEILYKVVGKATEILSSKKKGDSLDVIGPLGNGFQTRNGKLPIEGLESTILVAGGHGAAPLYALAKMLTVYRVQCTVFIGAKTKKHVVCDKELKKLGAKVYVATNDGSKGYRGLVTNLLKRTAFHRTGGTPVPPVRWKGLRSTIYACGPKPMLKEVAKLARQYNIPCQISLEEYMACGIGTCLGCAVKTRAGYKMVCKDGPVFDAKEVVW